MSQHVEVMPNRGRPADAARLAGLTRFAGMVGSERGRADESQKLVALADRARADADRECDPLVIETRVQRAELARLTGLADWYGGADRACPGLPSWASCRFVAPGGKGVKSGSRRMRGRAHPSVAGDEMMTSGKMGGAERSARPIEQLLGQSRQGGRPCILSYRCGSPFILPAQTGSAA